MVPGRKETRASFPHHPLLFLYTFYLSFTFPSCFSLSPSLSPLLHCFPMLLSLFGFPACSAAHRTSTRSQEHAKYVPTRFRHVVIFSKSCAAKTRQLWAVVGRGRPGEVQVSAKTSTYTDVWLLWVYDSMPINRASIYLSHTLFNSHIFSATHNNITSKTTKP